jgi:hypothetical protein
VTAELIRQGAWCAAQERARQTPTRRRRERLRREVLTTLVDPIMGAGPDHEIAADHGVPPAMVRHLRDRLARDRATHAILTRIVDLAALVGWRGSLDALLVRVLDGALSRATRPSGARNAAAATSGHVRTKAGPGGAQARPTSDDRRSKTDTRSHGVRSGMSGSREGAKRHAPGRGR